MCPAASLTRSTACAVSDVVADSIVVERARGETPVSGTSPVIDAHCSNTQQQAGPNTSIPCLSVDDEHEYPHCLRVTPVFQHPLQDMAGSLQSLCWASYALAQILTASVSGGLVQVSRAALSQRPCSTGICTGVVSTQQNNRATALLHSNSNRQPEDCTTIYWHATWSGRQI
jgi:hypothetical protein